MADEKKNPLIGAFRTPEPPKTPPDPKPAQPPGAAPAVQPKPEEIKKPDEPSKPTDAKATPTIGAAPAKADETKKPGEPGKPAADPKAPPASGTTTPAKADEIKKPGEPDKPATDPKTPPASGTTAPAKADEAKKPDEPKAAPTGGGTPVPAKSDEAKKPAEPPKSTGGDKPPADVAPPAEDDLPKNLHIPLTQPGQPESVVTLPLTDIHMFEGHPFNVNDDKDMWDLVESVKQFGVLEPAVVIPRKEGGYEMVSGHRRQRACQLAGLPSMPVIIRNLDRDEAIINMVDANLKRENISPMEKARAYDMKLEAMKRKSGRRSKTEILAGEKPKQAVEALAAQTGESATTIKKIRNLVNLNPDLQEMVDKNKIPVTAASDIASLKKEEQAVLADAMQREDKVPSITQAAELKAASKAGTLTTEKIEAVVAPTKREENPPLKVTFGEDELRTFFPDKRTTVPDVKRVVFDALTLRQKALENKAKQAAQGAPDKKKSAPAR